MILYIYISNVHVSSARESWINTTGRGPDKECVVCDIFTKSEVRENVFSSNGFMIYVSAYAYTYMYTYKCVRVCK